MPPHDRDSTLRTAWVALICLALLHTLVDTCALLIAPLWPRLEAVYGFGLAGLSVAFIAQSLPTSVSQAVFGWLRDRQPAPVWLWLGPIVAALFLTSIGLLENRSVLFALLLLGGIGVGAFHPEAAVLAGKLIPGERTRGISLFMFGGSLGLALGPIISGLIVTSHGLEGLAILTAPIVVLVLLLHRAGGLTSAATRLLSQSARVGAANAQRVADEPNQSDAEQSEPLPTISGILEGRGGFAVLMLLVCALRLVPNMAMDKVLAFTLSQPKWSFSETQIGVAQSVFLIAASAGMFVMVFRFRTGWEKAFMVGCPLAGVPLMLILGWSDCPPWLLFTTLAVSGAVLWGTSPAMVSYAQQQFPKGAGLASALTMGLAWGIGGLIQAPLTSYFQKVGTPQMTFVACVPCLLAAGLIATLMPGAQPRSGDMSW